MLIKKFETFGKEVWEVLGTYDTNERQKFLSDIKTIIDSQVRSSDSLFVDEFNKWAIVDERYWSLYTSKGKFTVIWLDNLEEQTKVIGIIHNGDDVVYAYDLKSNDCKNKLDNIIVLEDYGKLGKETKLTTYLSKH
jgi:hypothetical protein